MRLLRRVTTAGGSCGRPPRAWRWQSCWSTVRASRSICRRSTLGALCRGGSAEGTPKQARSTWADALNQTNHKITHRIVTQYTALPARRQPGQQLPLLCVALPGHAGPPPHPAAGGSTQGEEARFVSQCLLFQNSRAAAGAQPKPTPPTVQKSPSFLDTSSSMLCSLLLAEAAVVAAVAMAVD